MEKFPFHSDYVDSYLNYFLFSLSGNNLKHDALAFKNCVYLNPISLTLTNCADRRDKINEFISEKKEKFDFNQKVMKSTILRFFLSCSCSN